MTMELYGDSDVETFSETSSDDQDDIFSMYSGHAQSILSSIEDSIEKIDDFLSFERGFTYGDIVRSTKNPSGQMGKVVGLQMYVDLENLFGEVIKDVNSSKLLRMRSVLVGDYVIHGSWLGRVEKVVDKIGIVLDDGTRYRIMANDQANLSPLSPNLLDDSLYPYHPGQRVKVSHSMMSKPAGWFRGMSKKYKHEGTVFSVEVGLVYIDWISSAIAGSNVTFPPQRLQDPENLTLLSYFSHANWQLGDWCLLQSETRIQRSDLHPNLDEIYAIIKNKIKVDVVWQDGNCSVGLDTHSLFPVSVLNAHDFFPGQFVLEKTSSDDLVTPFCRRWGVVRCMDANERTVKVKWECTNGVTKDIDEVKTVEETVSAFELVEHPDFSFNIADIVFMSDTDPSVCQMNTIFTDRSTFGSKICDANINNTQKNCFLSSIGYVVGFESGVIMVEWASGVTTKVAPYKILRMEKDDGSVATHFLQEENSTELTYVMTDNEMQSMDQDISDKSGNDTEGCQNELNNFRLSSLSQVAMGFLNGIAANFFKSEGSTSKPHRISHTHTIDENKFRSSNKEDIVSCDKFPDLNTMKIGYFDTYKSLNSEADNTAQNSVLVVSRSNVAGQFKQFDVVEDCSDHHFVDAGGMGTALSQVRKGWLKKVQQEWNILGRDLPETIYVRIYEGRMDLLRAAIVGASGTPYQDGLFFFDLLLPPDYPNVPPLVHYHSGGLRLNPNLYESGRVCLSLLNTWTGSGSEVWNPGSSTILQVLLSLQALVLNERPYFNEAGYDQQIGGAEGENNSVGYNENAYLGTCKSMLYLLRRPLKNFEELVEEHFERRSPHILSACKAYMEGAPIGSSTKREHVKGNSMGFKIMLAKLFPKLVQAFSDKGIDCSVFVGPDM